MPKTSRRKNDFADKVALLALKVDFAEVARKSLEMLLGESATSAAIYHLGAEALQDPKVFEEKIKAIFGAAAAIILKKIVENLETTSEP